MTESRIISDRARFAKQRLQAIADGADIADVYGTEWCFDAPVTMLRKDLAALQSQRNEALEEALRCVDGDWEWLCDQLEQWPTRVHPDRTKCESYLRESAASIIRSLMSAPLEGGE